MCISPLHLISTANATAAQVKHTRGSHALIWLYAMHRERKSQVHHQPLKVCSMEEKSFLNSLTVVRNPLCLTVEKRDMLSRRRDEKLQQVMNIKIFIVKTWRVMRKEIQRTIQLQDMMCSSVYIRRDFFFLFAEYLWLTWPWLLEHFHQEMLDSSWPHQQGQRPPLTLPLTSTPLPDSFLEML